MTTAKRTIAINQYDSFAIALTSLWVAFILDSRHGLGTLLYLKCSITPFIFMLLNMIGVGFLLMVDAECIFILRTIAVWERERRFMVFKIINMIAVLLPIDICFFQDIVPSMGECSIPGGIIYLDMKARSSVIAMYCLLAFELLALVLYRGFESHGGWKIKTRLMRGLICSFGSCPDHSWMHTYLLNGTAFSLGVILATIFLPFSVRHMIAEFVQSCLEEAVVINWTAGLRSLLYLSWSHKCTGTSGIRIVFLLVTMEWISLSQRSWQQPQMLWQTGGRLKESYYFNYVPTCYGLLRGFESIKYVFGMQLTGSVQP
ncbi:uncharacterized protein F5891DRAFT_986076 [Suillus fuscotomentosus]|uniref:Uncharacterized protein n=1 Tax=Suillus fuscotomentosus TaxID=1912939 RepID=A0AAD4DT16_9AGAM|nr:uncharacterized protein F5891DRAFT_986076 [Suillus fuscotomentosus]KAG1893227.1 hypothetical protein F5891DRAFT_986076 [Suillus fuscotomentosus]